jgi:hypothetical protein
VGKGGREISIGAPRLIRRAHAEQASLPRDLAWARRHSPSKTGINALVVRLCPPYAGLCNHMPVRFQLSSPALVSSCSRGLNAQAAAF